jgi:hypothetical protein
MDVILNIENAIKKEKDKSTYVMNTIVLYVIVMKLDGDEL